jgi:hypothetical protein
MNFDVRDILHPLDAGKERRYKGTARRLFLFQGSL